MLVGDGVCAGEATAEFTELRTASGGRLEVFPTVETAARA